LKLYFCRTCDNRIASRLPPLGWLNLRRHVFPGSVAPPEGLSLSDQWVHRRRVSMGLGYFCSPNVWPPPCHGSPHCASSSTSAASD
jgi:hypothetical protein